MYDEILKKRFSKRFISESAIYIICNLVFIVTTIIAVNSYLQSDIDLWLVVVSSLLLVGCFIFTIIELILLISDFKLLKRGEYQKVTGTVVGYKIREQGGDAPTTVYFPIIKDEETGKQIKLDIMGVDVKNNIHKYCRYSFLYLPHTKYAVLTETFSFIYKNEKDSNYPL